MNSAEKRRVSQVSRLSPIFEKDSYSRMDETDDRIFYARERFVSHLDSLALNTVETLIDELIIEETPVILDLMAGWDSHIRDGIHPARVVGLGLNRNELEKNHKLDERVLHDLNKDPTLPFPDDTFDAVINTVSIDYMVKPVEVFKEVGRILKPGGLFLVIFSNRMFPQKAFKLWRESDESERVILVDEFFEEAGKFEKTSLFVSKGKPRPKDDKYADEAPQSDPVYAVYAEKKGGAPGRVKRPDVTVCYGRMPQGDDLAARKIAVKETLACPYCGEKMKKWAVPENPFCQTWDNDYMYICFNDECPYFVRGWDWMYRDTHLGMSYRCMYNPETNHCMPIPVPTPNALKDGIVE